MRRPLFLLALLPAALLAGCARTVDQFKPQIVVISPEGGAVSANKSFTLKGYVVDDRSVASLKVQGHLIPIKSGRIAPFSYQTTMSSHDATLDIEATDTSGNKSKLQLPIVVDEQAPKITVTKLERQGKSIHVAGVVTDNTSVVQVSVDGSVLNIAPGPSTEFYAETTGAYADIVAKDGAGNTANLRAR